MRIPLIGKRALRRDNVLDEAIALSRRLVTRAGEADGTKVAARLAGLLGKSDPDALLSFFRWLVVELGPARERLVPTAAAYLADPSMENAAQLTVAAEPERQELLRRLNTAPGGTALIVELRGRLLSLLSDHPDLGPLEADMRHLLASWFNRGFLELRRIDWGTSAAILEKLIAHEAVHAIENWEDLRGRLHGDRRCYAFFHPALPEEPLIFVEVALTDDISTTIAPLLTHPPQRQEATKPSTAVFYSISNCQTGLRGISFGNFLIKQIAEDLRVENPSLTVFATLSPVPGFRRWLENGPETDPARADLARLCAVYLAGPRSPGTDRRSIDPVAAFHLANGARLERINLAADASAKGQRQSYGVMVNYRYLPDAIEANHENFVSRGHVTMSPEVKALVRDGLRKRA